MGGGSCTGGMMPDGMNQTIGSGSSLFSRDNLRSMSELLGTGEDHAFGCLLSPPALLERMRHNIPYFYLNYIFLTVTFFCVNVLLKPTAWIGIGLLAVAWIGMANSIHDERQLKAACTFKLQYIYIYIYMVVCCHFSFK